MIQMGNFVSLNRTAFEPKIKWKVDPNFYYTVTLLGNLFLFHTFSTRTICITILKLCAVTTLERAGILAPRKLDFSV